MDITALQDALGYTFRNTALLKQALTHSSYAHEQGLGAACNERLEFLGDATLELVISDELYRQNAQLSEGELTKRRAALVCEPSLAGAARKVSLGTFLLLGRGEDLSGGRERDALLADAAEAVFGAVYLDGGYEQARGVILRFLKPSADTEAPSTADYKTALQEILHKNSQEPIQYIIIHETGPAHRKEFTASVSHGDRVLGTGTGRSKKEAEQNAADAAIRLITKR